MLGFKHNPEGNRRPAFRDMALFDSRSAPHFVVPIGLTHNFDREIMP
jgi:hypothetical protein